MYPLPIICTDFSGYWSDISSRLSYQDYGGPFQLNFNEIVNKEDQQNPLYKFNFVKNEDDAAIHLFIMSFNNKFDSKQTEEIKNWIDSHPKNCFIVLILNIVEKVWKIPTSKSKVENQFKASIPNSESISSLRDMKSVFILKYQPDSSITDSEIQELHHYFEQALTYDFNANIARIHESLFKTPPSDPEFVSLNGEYISIMYTYGFHITALKHFSLFQQAVWKQFWPESPNLSCKFSVKINTSTGFDVIISSFSYLLHEMKRPNSKLDNGISMNFINWSFSQCLENSQTPEQKLFSRFWIYQTASNLTDVFFESEGTQKVELSPIFSMIAFNQLLEIFTLETSPDFPLWKDSPFLKNVETLINITSTEIGRSQFFVTEWSKTRKIFIDLSYQFHTRYLNSLFFKFLISKDDLTTAKDFIKDTELDPFKSKLPIMLNESDCFSTMLDIALKNNDQSKEHQMKIITLSKLLFSGRIPHDYHKKALEILSEYNESVIPSFSIKAHIHCPSIFSPHILDDCISFNLSFRLPLFLLPLISYTYLTLKGSSSDLKTTKCPMENVESLETDFDQMSKPIRANYDCQLSSLGIFKSCFLNVVVKNLTIKFPLKLPCPLEVTASKNPILITGMLPHLFRTGATQSARFLVENLDPSKAHQIKFGYSTIKEIRIGSQKFGPEQLTFTLPPNSTGSKIEIVVVFVVDEEDLNMVIREDVPSESFSDVSVKGYATFDIAPRPLSLLRLFKQGKKFQQFQINNQMDAHFTFEYGGEKHVIEPNTPYYILRESSETPLSLELIEEGWEEFPLKIVSSLFILKPLTVSLNVSLAEERWEIGEPREIVVDPPAEPLVSESGDNPWIVATINPEKTRHILIPKRAGKIHFPNFVIKEQVAEPEPGYVVIHGTEFPPFIPL